MLKQIISILFIFIITSCALKDYKFYKEIENKNTYKKIEYLSLPLFSKEIQKKAINNTINYLNANSANITSKKLGEIELDQKSTCSGALCDIVENKDGSQNYFFKIYANFDRQLDNPSAVKTPFPEKL